MTEPGDLPAFHSNRFTVGVGDEVTRFAFGEDVDGKLYYRSAISMTTADAIVLANMILALVEKHRTREQ